MFEDINNGHTCYCENCLKLQEENRKLISTNNFLSMYIVEANNIKDKNKKLEQKFEKIKEVLNRGDLNASETCLDIQILLEEQE